MAPDLAKQYEIAVTAEREAFRKMLDVDPATPEYVDLVNRWKDAMTATDKARQAMLLVFGSKQPPKH